MSNNNEIIAVVVIAGKEIRFSMNRELIEGGKLAGENLQEEVERQLESIKAKKGKMEIKNTGIIAQSVIAYASIRIIEIERNKRRAQEEAERKNKAEIESLRHYLSDILGINEAETQYLKVPQYENDGLVFVTRNHNGEQGLFLRLNNGTHLPIESQESLVSHLAAWQSHLSIEASDKLKFALKEIDYKNLEKEAALWAGMQ